ncbi:hypothetical protein DFJ77DRAFT_478542 [Powellomyces hirtus]|nr:hypothetical protein DFJ77DRAFT_478542 [Powellomyces hirtus]
MGWLQSRTQCGLSFEIRFCLGVLLWLFPMSYVSSMLSTRLGSVGGDTQSEGQLGGKPYASSPSALLCQFPTEHFVCEDGNEAREGHAGLAETEHLHGHLGTYLTYPHRGSRLFPHTFWDNGSPLGPTSCC